MVTSDEEITLEMCGDTTVTITQPAGSVIYTCGSIIVDVIELAPDAEVALEFTVAGEIHIVTVPKGGNAVPRSPSAWLLRDRSFSGPPG